MTLINFLRLSVSIFFTFFLLTQGVSQKKLVSLKAHKGKYHDMVPDSEKVIRNGYHWILSREVDGKYVYRTFYPETKQLTSEERYSNKKLRKREGKATYWYDNGNLREEGTYKKDQKHGLWSEYFWESEIIEARGAYREGEKLGKWEYFNPKGRLIMEELWKKDSNQAERVYYNTDGMPLHSVEDGKVPEEILLPKNYGSDFTSNKIVKGTSLELIIEGCNDEKSTQKLSDCNQQKLLEHIYSQIRYPAQARELGVTGTSYTLLRIRADGSVKSIKVISGLSPDIKEECFRVAKSLPTLRPKSPGKALKGVNYILPIRFQIR